MKNEKDFIYVHGHRNPDTDSVVSAIAYAHLKNELGVKAVACRLGGLSEETDYILEKFGFEAPILLKDARATLDEIDVDSPIEIHVDTSIKDAMDILQKSRQTLAVVDDRSQLMGVVTSSNLTHIAMGDTAHSIELLKRTPVENIVKAIDGTLVYKPKEFRFNGKTSIVAIAESGLSNYQLDGRLVIIGDDVNAQMEAINKGAACIVTVWTQEIEDAVIKQAIEKGCAIIMSSHGTMNTSRYLLFSPSIREVMTTDLVYFNKNEFVEDVESRMLKTRYRAYPVLDDNNHIYGFISRYHILNSQSKRLILVDHNEYSQSVEGVEDAEILEVIDHHRIGDINTIKPIYFRNEIIGSTASIITKMYHENGVNIPKNIASILLSALISDTLNLKSPTATQQDFRLALQLEAISGLDRYQFAQEMYEVTSTLKNKPYEDIINQDIKTFYISGKEVMVSQVVIYHFTELDTIHETFEEALEAYVLKHKLDLLVVVFTSIEDNGSIVVSAGNLKNAVLDAFPNEDGQERTFLQDIVSRKNQIIPRLSSAIAKVVDGKR
ncbi:putative manganese-dependent inorganic diphosphatase [Erysipelothrix sp. HDW6C]|uniref:putative manganese-dependent inorganic diphosphatase n=1 Tax=Erysipelothrix sp. HDW6C TaxID=2714930 RepID=UPI00140C3164|nr:putative manganese-dependent inorganic diphosphatase [Erysipelothrix sp. HDW6C]QIK70474.1 putative manganese-dependent inorganic diphosphatase [Erysipelothrix sp. HDW6C]